jgi:type IV secretion system protein TrbL
MAQGSTQTIDVGVITDMQNQFLNVFSSGAEDMVGHASAVLTTLCAIQIAWAAYEIMWGEARVAPKMARTIIKCGVYVALVTQAPFLFDMIFDFFVEVGTQAGGGGASTSYMKDPGGLPAHMLTITAPVFVEMQGSGGWMEAVTGHPVGMFFAGLVGITLVILSMVMAVQIFVATIEFYVVAALGLIFMPFGVLKHTAFLAENFFGAIIAVATKMAALSMIVAATEPLVKQQVALKQDYQLNDLFGLLIMMMALTMLYLRGPKLAAGLMSGRASLSGTDFVAGAVASGVPAAVAGPHAGRAAAGAKGGWAVGSKAGMAAGPAGAVAAGVAAGTVGAAGAAAGGAVKDGVSSSAKESVKRMD